MSKLADKLLAQVTDAGYPPEALEYHFAPVVDGKPVRRWRADWAYPSAYVLVEIDGGLFVGGRHTRGAAFQQDAQKRNIAQLLGWTVIVLTDKDQWKGRAARMVEAAVERTGRGRKRAERYRELVGALLDE